MNQRWWVSIHWDSQDLSYNPHGFSVGMVLKMHEIAIEASRQRNYIIGDYPDKINFGGNNCPRLVMSKTGDIFKVGARPAQWALVRKMVANQPD